MSKLNKKYTFIQFIYRIMSEWLHFHEPHQKIHPNIIFFH